MTHTGTSFAPAHHVPSIDRAVQALADAGVILQTADDTEHLGRHVIVGGEKLLNFGSCGYLGLELRSEVKEGAIRAIRRYGTQFPFPRVFVQSPLYQELEAALSAMTGGHALVTPSTTLAHMAALPVLIEEGDAVLIDQFAHASLHTGVALLHGIRIVPVRHNRVDVLERKVKELAKTYRRIWYIADGLYSMLGDFAPMREIAALLERTPQLHLYIDDAHSTSWTGVHGRGHALDHFADRSRVVVTLSLNKGFGAGGGALIFAGEDDRARVQRCGGPMLFSGPLQPALLGAAVASAQLQLRPEFADSQRALRDRIDLTVSLARALGVPLASADPTPIFFVRCGALEVLFALSQALRDRGIYVCASGFPAVPLNQSGLRFTLSLHNTENDIRFLMEELARTTARLGITKASGTPDAARAPADDSDLSTTLT